MIAIHAFKIFNISIVTKHLAGISVASGKSKKRDDLKV
jgi:hypothetical protein